LETERRRTRDSEYTKQLDHKTHLDEEINKQQTQLNAIGKSSKGVQFSDGEVNIDQMLEKLRSTI
jgi:hypothetical protein